MNAFRAWISLIVCGGLGVLIASGYQLPLDPGCIGRCRLDGLARMQRDIGSAPLSAIFFALGLFGFVWYSARS